VRREKQIVVVVTSEELQIIQREAKKLGLTPASYLRMLALQK